MGLWQAAAPDLCSLELCCFVHLVSVLGWLQVWFFSMGVLETLGKVVQDRDKVWWFVGCSFSDQGESVGRVLGGQLEWVVEWYGREGEHWLRECKI